MNKVNYIEKEKCQHIYLNLMRMLEEEKKSEPVHILSEVLETERCDHIHDISDLRKKTKKYIDKMNPETYERLTGPFWTDGDRYIAFRTLLRHKLWYRKVLMQGLSFRKKIEYYVWYKPQFKLTTLKIDSGGIYTGNIIWRRGRS